MTLIRQQKKIRLQKNEILIISKLKRDTGIPIKQLSRKTGLKPEVVGDTLRALRKRNIVWSMHAKTLDPFLHSQSLLWYLS